MDGYNFSVINIASKDSLSRVNIPSKSDRTEANKSLHQPTLSLVGFLLTLINRHGSLEEVLYCVLW